MNTRHWIPLYLQTVRYSLLVFGLLKLLSLVQSRELFKLADPVLLIPTSYVFFLAAIFEIALFFFLGLRKRLSLRLSTTLWFSGILVIYRTFAHLSSANTPCPCLGFFADWLPISRATSERLPLVFLSYYLIGSCLGLIILLKNKENAPIIA